MAKRPQGVPARQGRRRVLDRGCDAEAFHRCRDRNKAWWSLGVDFKLWPWPQRKPSGEGAGASEGAEAGAEAAGAPETPEWLDIGIGMGRYLADGLRENVLEPFMKPAGSLAALKSLRPSAQKTFTPRQLYQAGVDETSKVLFDTWDAQQQP